MADLHKPRILCLHGGGVSAHIFELQMRHFIRSLAPHFRLVFADGPWLSEMHDDLKPVYSNMGPCRRWGRWLPHHPPVDHKSAVEQIERSLTDAMDEDNGYGEWVGLVGFSQGAKLALSILLENQLRRQKDTQAGGFAGVHWQFGIIMAGRAAPFNLSRQERPRSKHYSSLTRVSSQFDREYANSPGFPDRLRTPTLHVHGLKDGGLDLHRDLLKFFTSPAHARLVEWDGAHRIPFKTADVNRITDAILEVAKAAEFLAKTEYQRAIMQNDFANSKRYGLGVSAEVF